MRILIICSKYFYSAIPPIKETLERAGHSITLPNCFDDPGTEERMRTSGNKTHAKWKASMIAHSEKIIATQDAVLVPNFEKHSQPNYIGGATFLEIYDAFRLGKVIYMYNPIPAGMLHDELCGFQPVILNGKLELIGV